MAQGLHADHKGLICESWAPTRLPLPLLLQLMLQPGSLDFPSFPWLLLPEPTPGAGAVQYNMWSWGSPGIVQQGRRWLLS